MVCPSVKEKETAITVQEPKWADIPKKVSHLMNIICVAQQLDTPWHVSSRDGGLSIILFSTYDPSAQDDRLIHQSL